MYPRMYHSPCTTYHVPCTIFGPNKPLYLTQRLRFLGQGSSGYLMDPRGQGLSCLIDDAQLGVISTDPCHSNWSGAAQAIAVPHGCTNLSRTNRRTAGATKGREETRARALAGRATHPGSGEVIHPRFPIISKRAITHARINQTDRVYTTVRPRPAPSRHVGTGWLLGPDPLHTGSGLPHQLGQETLPAPKAVQSCNLGRF